MWKECGCSRKVALKSRLLSGVPASKLQLGTNGVCMLQGTSWQPPSLLPVALRSWQQPPPAATVTAGSCDHDSSIQDTSLSMLNIKFSHYHSKRLYTGPPHSTVDKCCIWATSILNAHPKLHVSANIDMSEEWFSSDRSMSKFETMDSC